MPRSRYLPFLVLGLVGAALVAYQSSFAGALVFDDHREIEQNPGLHHLWPPANVFGAIRTRPIVAYTLAINYAIGGLDPRGYHAFNLAIHVLAALVLFGLVRRTLTGRRLGPRYGAAAVPLAFAVALLWVVHPLQTGSVTYLIQRAEVLMGLFYLTTLYALARLETTSRPALWQVVAVASCVAGMASKQVMVTAPLVALLYDRAFLSRSFTEALRARRFLYSGLAATWMVLAAVGTALVASHRLLFNAGRFGALEYALSQPRVLLHYLRLAVWPHPLCFDYHDWPVARSLADRLPPLVLIGILLATTGLAWRRHQPLAFLGAFFFLVLATTSSVIPTKDLVFEHRMYLPLAAVITGIAIACHEGLGALEERLSITGMRRTLGVSLVATTALALAATTNVRNRAYGSELGLWQDTLAKRPASVRARINIGTELARRGRFEEGQRFLEQALALNPNQPEALFNRGRILLIHGKLTEALADFRAAVRILPAFAFAHESMAEVLLRLGQPEEATAHLREAQRLKGGP